MTSGIEVGNVQSEQLYLKFMLITAGFLVSYCNESVIVIHIFIFIFARWQHKNKKDTY